MKIVVKTRLFPGANLVDDLQPAPYLPGSSNWLTFKVYPKMKIVFKIRFLFFSEISFEPLSGINVLSSQSQFKR